jgi:hypothetical protein
VCGAIWQGATEVWAFIGPVGAWWRIFSRRQEGEEVYYTYPASDQRKGLEPFTSAQLSPAQTWIVE